MALATALVVFILLLAISSGNGAVWVFIGAMMIAGVVIIWVMNLKTASDFSEDIAIENDTSVLSQIETSAPQPQPVIDEKVRALFGTTNMEKITGSIKAMYTELSGFRANNEDKPDLSTKIQEQEDMIKALTSERDEAKTLASEWEAKVVSNFDSVERLKKEVEEHEKWEVVNDEQLAAFFPTVHLGDKEEPFLASNRRQRRLMQRLSAEGYSIVRKTN